MTQQLIHADAPKDLASLGTQVAATRTTRISPEEIETGLHSAGAVAYRWDVTTDELSWGNNVEQVLGLPPYKLATGKHFASYLESENLTSRFDAVVNSKSADNGMGVPFEIEYKFRADGSTSSGAFWLEDSGAWRAGTNGRAAIVHGLVRRIDARHLQNQNLVHLSTSDPLTGTINRIRMTDVLSDVVTNAVREHSSCGFAIAAIANLGVINEAYGFEVADEVIAHVAKRLKMVMRGGDLLARYSGSKFGFVLNNCSPLDLTNAGERLLAVIRDNVIETSRGPVWAVLALGAVSIPESTQDTLTAIAYAEDALNEARGRPTDACVIYKLSESRQIKQALNARCAAEIVTCLKEGTFKLAFQPILDAKSGKVVMHEALLRMIDETGEIIPAGHLVPVAEHIGLIRLIDRNVVQMAITMLHSYPDAVLSINISANSASDTRWNTELLELLGADTSIAKRLVIELSEQIVFSETEPTKRFIAALQAIGCKVAVDDFGAGYTSFRNVRGLNIDMLKLDGSFCHDLSNNPESRYYARSLIELGKTFGIKTIAEWVESESDAAVLKDLGIDFMQGLYLGDAMIEPPWDASVGAAFALQPEPPAAGELAAESPVLGSDQAPREESTDIYDYDDGIAKMRETLAMLDSIQTAKTLETSSIAV